MPPSIGANPGGLGGLHGGFVHGPGPPPQGGPPGQGCAYKQFELTKKAKTNTKI